MADSTSFTRILCEGKAGSELKEGPCDELAHMGPGLAFDRLAAHVGCGLMGNVGQRGFMLASLFSLVFGGHLLWRPCHVNLQRTAKSGKFIFRTGWCKGLFFVRLFSPLFDLKKNILIYTFTPR